MVALLPAPLYAQVVHLPEISDSGGGCEKSTSKLSSPQISDAIETLRNYCVSKGANFPQQLLFSKGGVDDDDGNYQSN